MSASSTQDPDRDGPSVNCLSWILIGILGLILAAIIVPNFIRPRAQARMVPCKSNLKNIGTALEMYSTDWKGKYPKNLSMLTPKYLKTLPTCTSAGRVTYAYATDGIYNTKDFRDYYVIWCAGGHHTSAGYPEDFPQYDGLRGLYEGRK